MNDKDSSGNFRLPATEDAEDTDDSVQVDPISEELRDELKNAVKDEQQSKDVATEEDLTPDEEEEEQEDVQNEELEAEPIVAAEKPQRIKMPSLMRNMDLPKFKLPKIRLQEIPGKIMYTLREYKRVIIVSKKPDIDELSKISKISAIGIAVIGLIGFVIQIIFQLIGGFK